MINLQSLSARFFFFSVFIFIAFFLQSSTLYHQFLSFYKISFVFPFLLLSIFFLPAWSSFSIILITAFFIDITSSNLDGIYMVSYFFSLLPIYFFADKVKQDFFLPVFLITFLSCYIIKTFLEMFTHSLFYNFGQAFLHFRNKGSLEIILNTVFSLFSFLIVRFFIKDDRLEM